MKIYGIKNDWKLLLYLATTYSPIYLKRIYAKFLAKNQIISCEVDQIFFGKGVLNAQEY